MYKQFSFCVLILLFLLTSRCKQVNNERLPVILESVTVLTLNSKPVSKSQFWYYKDIINDTLPGISLEKAYSELLTNKEAKEVIVAVIDMAIDIEHPDLTENIWVNSQEIAGNNIDDDQNGYIDDINGWNFLGRPNGESNEFVNYEYTRIIREYDSKFVGLDSNNINMADQPLYQTYSKAKKMYSKRLEYAQSSLDNSLGSYEYFISMKEAISPYFPNDDYSTIKLDSLKSIYDNQEPLSTFLTDMITFESYGITESQLFEEKIKSEERINKLLNLDYNERKEIGDDETDLNDVNYGNNIVNSNVKRMNHGTGMAGVIAAVRSNSIGSKGISDKIKIMPIIISAFGDEHDKDMALAIRYAADNGAKVINISSGKYFSLRKEWVESAISYAEAKNVLIVNSAGNDNLELTLKGDLTYPNDSKLDGSAISNNFIKVGASSYDLSKLKGSSSNYGYAEVDMFAPGVDIYTLDSTTGGYKTISGTSSAAALTSGIAALIWSYYPSLNASEVKYILINSGIRYENIVSIETKDKKIISEKFQNLSKNGKILNAYFALKLAEKLN